MENQIGICQSCGIPLNSELNKGGTNADKSLSDKYCSICYQDGKFTTEGFTLNEQIEKVINTAVTKLNMSESSARNFAESTLPTLDRWKEQK